MPQQMSQRVPTDLPVWVTGRDYAGRQFKQTARIVDVSQNGGRLDGIRCLRGPGEVVEVRCRGKQAAFRVVWADEVRGQAGIYSPRASDRVWGMAVPAGPGPAERLPALKPAEVCAKTPEPVAASGKAPSSAPLSSQLEQRRHARHHCVGGVTAKSTSGQQRVWGQLRLISQDGCFVDAVSPLGQNTGVELWVRANEVELKAAGKVRWVEPGVGMGIAFTQMDAENRQRLNGLIAKLDIIP